MSKNKGILLLIIPLEILLWLTIFFVGNLFSQNSDENIAILRNEFKQYHTDNELAYIDNEIVYFDEYEVYLYSLLEKANIKEVHIIGGEIYFSAVKDVLNLHILYLCKCDLYGNNYEILLKKENLYNVPKMVFNNCEFYYLFKDKTNSNGLGIFNIKTREIEEQFCATEINIDEYKPDTPNSIYTSNVLEDCIEICENGTNKKRTINIDTYSNTIYNNSLKKYPPIFKNVLIIENRILLCYFIELEDLTTRLVFEYNFDLNQIVYKTLIFPDDVNGYFMFIN